MIWFVGHIQLCSLVLSCYPEKKANVNFSYLLLLYLQAPPGEGMQESKCPLNTIPLVASWKCFSKWDQPSLPISTTSLFSDDITQCTTLWLLRVIRLVLWIYPCIPQCAEGKVFSFVKQMQWFELSSKQSTEDDCSQLCTSNPVFKICTFPQVVSKFGDPTWFTPIPSFVSLKQNIRVSCLLEHE